MKKSYEAITDDIINNNYIVQRFFDDHNDGFVGGKYLSKKQAMDLLKTTRAKGHVRYDVVERLAIIGIVPFNNTLAYVFNQKLNDFGSKDKIRITCNDYEGLMDCYVFAGESIDKKSLLALVNEYHNRGGLIYNKYHSFNDEKLCKFRRQRQQKYRDNIVYNSIFKHGFREIKKNTWGDGAVVITTKDCTTINMHYPSHNTHTSLNVCKARMMMIGSIFGPFMTMVNQLSGDTFGITCGRKPSNDYYFTRFEIKFQSIEGL
jgi:hypothetical protein